MKVRIFRYRVVLLAVCLVLCGAIFVRRAKGAGPFVINSNADTSDANPGDGVCATAANVCTLRAAIQEVNKLGGAQGPAIITFDLGGGGNVAPTSGLPFITSPVIIDGATGGTRRVQLIGTNAGFAYGLVLGTGSGGSQVSSLVIRNFSIDGLVLGSNGNTIRDCYIGTDFFGTVKQANGNDGIRIDGSNNSIGGTTANALNVISGNSRYGVHIDLTTAQGNQIQGNYIGTNADGTATLGNGDSGVVVRGPFNTIGGSSAEARNVISGNGRYGVDVEGSAASNTTIQSNYIGTNAAGTAAIFNVLDGLLITDAPFNTIGGTTGTAGNLISGNDSKGLWLIRSGHNLVQGNLIGTDKTGTAPLPNRNEGVDLQESGNNMIGGTLTGASNVISGNSGSGVVMSSSQATGNKLQGNYIGTNAAGTAALGNGKSGVVLVDGAVNNTVGGNDGDDGIADGVVRARNIISGNKEEGVYFTGSNGNLVQGNYIGTDATGTVALGNGQNGVKILGSPNITIGGLTAGARNLISGNGNDGVLVNSDGANPSKVQGNHIGTDASGSVALGNGAAGVALFTANNMVGGTTLQARNVISGNGREGVYIAAIGNYVQGNFIGTNAAGTAALGNTFDGVKMDGAPSTFVGGTQAGARNVISGNHGAGISISGSGATNNIIQGNFIGTDVNGTTALQNEDYGISIVGASNNLIGGTSVGARNIISKNKGDGIGMFEGVSGKASGNLVQGNFIGTDVTGTAPLGNGGSGVGLYASPNNTVGGADAARNIISGNMWGVRTSFTADGNKVQGNYIGTDVTGTANLGNAFDGVQIVNSVNSIIGGGAGLGNIIAFNGGRGVSITGSVPKDNALLHNSIFSNGQLGIDLKADGVTANDTGDADAGPNNLQNYPNVTSAVSNPTNNTTSLQGSLNSTANTTFTIEFFSSEVQDATGFGEGQTFRNSTTVTTNSSGNVMFNVTLNAAVPGGHVVTATATDPSNNTSEFSQAVTVIVQTYTISGRVTNGQNGTGFPDVTVSLSGSQTITTQTDANGNYSFTAQAGGNYTVTPSKTNFTFNPPSQTFSNLSANASANFVGTATPQSPTIVQFSTALYSVGEGDGHVDAIVTRSGDTSGAASVSFSTSDLAGAQSCNVTNGLASSRCDYETRIATVTFAPGETSKAVSVLIIDDSYLEGSETFTVNLSNPVGASLGTPATATVAITDNDLVTGTNPIDTAGFFVRQHYLDFLNREPDQSGFDFWTNQITSCGSDTQCTEIRRINVSAAFYLSIEFQETGYLVERIYKASYGDASGTSTFGGSHQLPVPVIRLNEFLPDTQEIGQGVVVGQGNWQQQLEDNKNAFTTEFVQRSRFTTALPTSLTAAQFVDQLNQNAGNPLSQSERDQLVSDLNGGAKTRAQVLRAVAEDQDLNNSEFNRAFVLMQYFGYLRRNPNDPQDTDYTGYDFWLTKLNQFNGNFVNAEMVKAFIVSGEYRNRFGP